MSISRRTLLGTLVGTLVGFPFGIKAAQATEIGDIKVTGISGFDKQRIEDIGNAFLSDLERHMIFKDIRYTDDFDPDWPATWGSVFIIPSSYSEGSIRTMLREYAMPAMECLTRELIEHHNSKCRYYGVDIYRYNGRLAVWMTFSHDQEKPYDPDAFYSTWTRAL